MQALRKLAVIGVAAATMLGTAGAAAIAAPHAVTHAPVRSADSRDHAETTSTDRSRDRSGRDGARDRSRDGSGDQGSGPQDQGGGGSGNDVASRG